MATNLDGVDPKLEALLGRVFADGVLESREREELSRMWREARLTLPVVRATFAAFVRHALTEAKSDGVVTEAEREKLRAIVRELKLPKEMIPEEVAKLIAAP